MLTFAPVLFRAKVRPSKKARVNNPSEDHAVIEPELTTEPEGPNTEATLDEPPPLDHNVDEPAEVETAVPDGEPASPIWAANRPSSPVRTTDIPSTPENVAGDKEGEVIITGMSHISPGHPVILAKHSAKEEHAAMEKGKWSTDLSIYAHLSAQELHSGFLNRLHSNRDYEAGLVNLMKERYEVFSSLFPFLNPICKYQLK